jgi:hypothetical protein
MAGIRRAFEGPAFLAESAVPRRYDGFVDYGVIAGEQVAFDLPGTSPSGGGGEVRAIFAADGALLGEVIVKRGGTLVAVLDGVVMVDGRSMPLGWSFYDLTEPRDKWRFLVPNAERLPRRLRWPTLGDWS